MTLLPATDPLARAVRELLRPEGCATAPPGEVWVSPLPSARQVCRFQCPQEPAAAVGKFFSAYPPTSPSDRSLAAEYHNYLRAAALGLCNGSQVIPRLLGRRPEVGLGLLLAFAAGPDLDELLMGACVHDDCSPLFQGLESLAELLAFFHTRPVPPGPASPDPALIYLEKLLGQLQDMGLLAADDHLALQEEKIAWETRLQEHPDLGVLVHGDATPTNFLFPDGRAVALDLERLRVADRLWDLSWVAGELKHAWVWRGRPPEAAEGAIGHFFRAYLAALPQGAAMSERLFRLNPFYMALAELRIARNAYLSWDYRRGLVAEARRCLAAGRRM